MTEPASRRCRTKIPLGRKWATADNSTAGNVTSDTGSEQVISLPMQFEAFARGFMMLCGGPAIHLFSATELERLVCGNPILDFAALQANARYDGGYHAEHKVTEDSLHVHPGVHKVEDGQPVLMKQHYVRRIRTCTKSAMLSKSMCMEKARTVCALYRWQHPSIEMAFFSSCHARSSGKTWA